MAQMQMLDLELLINSRYTFIAVTTDEEDRLQDMLRRLAVRLGIPFYVWTSAQGLTRPPFTQLASVPDRQPLQALAQAWTCPPRSGRCRRCSSWSSPHWRSSRPWFRTGSASSVPAERSGST
jgi:hypothetical protein